MGLVYVLISKGYAFLELGLLARGEGLGDWCFLLPAPCLVSLA